MKGKIVDIMKNVYLHPTKVCKIDINMLMRY